MFSQKNTKINDLKFEIQIPGYYRKLSHAHSQFLSVARDGITSFVVDAIPFQSFLVNRQSY